MPELSVAIITKDEIERIGPCIESVRAIAAEVVVVDSGSTDGTAALCRQLGAHVLELDWAGYGTQKNRAVRAAKHDWVLSLDADERVTPQLSQAIRAAMAAPRYRAYRLRRCTRFLGRYLRHGEGYPDWSLRLFDRRCARWSDDSVHEKVLFDGPIGTLPGDLLHDTAESLEAYLAKQNRYTSLAAADAIARGARASTARMLLSPLLRFVKFYFLRRGLLDGVPGLIHIACGCFNSFTRYAKIREGRAHAQNAPRLSD